MSTERTLNYHFLFEDGSEWSYTLRFDERGNFIPVPTDQVKKWTELSTHQCSHCPLSTAKHPQCPVARNLDQIVEDSKDSISCTKALVTVTTPERTYQKDCAAQVGLHSLFGLIMASSGCPHLDWLKPLARFHLPFSELDDTVFRVLTLQLLTDYFSDGTKTINESVDKVKDRYLAVEKVNSFFIKRIRLQCDGDADKNALVTLNVFAQMFEYEQRADFQRLKIYFTD